MSNNGPNNVPMATQQNKHISQTSRYQLIFLCFNESKTAFIMTIVREFLKRNRKTTSSTPNMWLINYVLKGP
jgi:hypothetical protein